MTRQRRMLQAFTCWGRRLYGGLYPATGDLFRRRQLFVFRKCQWLRDNSRKFPINVTVPSEWEVRVGVHSGPVVAGVVGQERYQFDIWGDTVNVAARMSDKSSPGSVAVTKDVWSGTLSRGKRSVKWKSKERVGFPSSASA